MAKPQTIRVKINGIDKTRAKLRRLARNMQNMQPMMEEIGDAMVKRIRDRMAAGKSPSNRRLPKPKDGIPVINSGRLRDSIGYEAGPRNVRIGTDVAYARFVQLGTKGMRPRPFIKNEKGRVAAGDVRTIREITRKAINEMLEEKAVEGDAEAAFALAFSRHINRGAR